MRQSNTARAKLKNRLMNWLGLSTFELLLRMFNYKDLLFYSRSTFRSCAEIEAKYRGENFRKNINVLIDLHKIFEKFDL